MKTSMKQIIGGAMRFKKTIRLNGCLPIVSILLIALLFIPIAGNAGRLATIEITSVPALGTPPTIAVGQSVVFTAEGKDRSGNTVPIRDPRWYSGGGHGTIVVDPNDPNKCTYTATNRGADYIQCCDGKPGYGPDGSKDFTVKKGGTKVPTTVKLDPESATITKGKKATFKATVTDQNGNKLPDEPVTFTATGGPITPEGVYTGEEVGEQTVTVKVTSRPEITDTSIVTVDPFASYAIAARMFPGICTIPKGALIKFAAIVFDQNNKEMPDEPVTYTATGGPITPEGVYTGEEVGEQTVTVKVTSRPEITDTSIVTVDPFASYAIAARMFPGICTIPKGALIKFAAIVFDQNNKEMPDEPVTYTATGGPITPEGVYTGEEVGEQTVTVKVTSRPEITDTSIVTVDPFASYAIAARMFPGICTIPKGALIKFAAIVFDQNDKEMPDEPVTYTATGGPITPEGVYTGEEVGEQTVTVKVTSNPSITDTSIVTVVDPGASVPTIMGLFPERITVSKGGE